MEIGRDPIREGLRQMSIPDAAWRTAYAKQSFSDFQTYEYLCDAKGLPHCHRLHYLQMCLEKLCKAYRYDRPLDELSLRNLQSTHGVIAKILPQIVREHWRQVGLGSARKDQLQRVREICRELDLLAPSVDDGGRRPDNVEYPWPSPEGVGMNVPCEYKFAIDQRLRSSDGRMLLKVAAAALALLASR